MRRLEVFRLAVTSVWKWFLDDRAGVTMVVTLMLSRGLRRRSQYHEDHGESMLPVLIRGSDANIGPGIVRQ